MKLVYLGGPVSGLSYTDAQNWRVYFGSLLADGIKALSPMRGETQLISESKLCDFYDDMLMSNRKAVLIKDAFDVRRCDALVCNVLGAKEVSKGSVMEMAWAYMLGKPIILVMDTPSVEYTNPHDHGMIREAAGWVVPTLEQAADVVNTLLTPGV